mmetsp:Transcript_30210/g.46200  ORF Transcript_30210/g.46200 Transcript_30210/m.46200 type:complete len:99 (-) Transcript_30210:1515-1811(-)
MTEEVANLVQDSHEMINRCKHSSVMLLCLINDLLDLAKQENMTFELQKSYFNLVTTVKESLKTLEFISEQKGIKTRFVFNPKNLELFEMVYGDEKRYE